MRWSQIRLGLSVAAALLMLCVPTLHAADSYAIGQKVEVREGDTWSAATILAREGRKWQIHYASGGGDDEWIFPDRIRMPGTTGTTPAPSPAPTPTTAPTAKPAVDSANYGGFKVGDKVEVKWGGMWRKADLVRQANGWTLISYDQFSSEWVQVWRIRNVGTTATDTSPYARPRESVKKNAAPPTLPPDDITASDEPGEHGSKVAEVDLSKGPDGLEMVKPDLSAGHDLEPTSTTGAIVPDAPISATAPKTISLHHGPPAFGTRSEMLIHPQGKAVLMAFTPVSNEEPSSMQVITLAGGDAGKVCPFSNRDYPLAISPDAKHMATRSERSDREKMWRLDLWSLASSTPKALLCFRPYDTGNNSADAVITAFFPDATHLLTISGNHMVTLWEFTDTAVKEIYTLQSDGSIFPQVSPGGKYLTAAFNGQVVVCDILTGNCVAKSAALVDSFGLTSSLRSDAKRLALMGERRLIVQDLQNSRVLLDVGMPEDLHGSRLAWLGLNLLLVDDHMVFDVDHKAVVWDYTGGAPLGAMEGDHFWCLSQSNGGSEGNNRSFLTSFIIPDAKVQAADQKIPDGVTLVSPGSQISLEVNFNGSSDDRQKIVDRFTRQLASDGITVADGQPVKLICETKDGHSETKTYSAGPFGKNRGNETVTATQTIYRVAFESEGKELWAITSMSGGYLPNMIWLKQDQSAADAIAAENKPQLTWFLRVDLPRTILKPMDPVGTSPFSGSTGMAGMGRARNGR